MAVAAGGDAAEFSTSAERCTPRVFLSYSRADRARIAAVAERLQAAGVTVWWDTQLQPGARFAHEIAAQLEAADVIVVGWSATSVGSEWVLDEADVGRRRGRLVPFSLDSTEPPLGFRQIQTIDLSHWDGTGDDPAVHALVTAIRRTAGAPAPAVAPAATPALPRARRRPALMPWAAALVLLLLAAGAAALWRARTPAPPASPPLVAVLPFVEAGGNLQLFAAGLSEEVTDALAGKRGLRVLGSASARTIQESGADPADARRRLGVDWLIAGSIRGGTDTSGVRVTVRLIDTATGQQRWTRRFERAGKDLVGLQEELAGTIANAVAPAEAQAAQAPRAGVEGTAYVDSVVARQLVRAREANALLEARKLASAIIERTPDYAPAYATRALATILGNFYSPNPVRDSQALAAAARADAETAIRLDPNLADAYDALGTALYYSGERAKALIAFERAVALKPDSAEAHLHLGSALAEDAQLVRGVSELRTAARLDPLWPIPAASILLSLEFQNDREGIRAEAERFRTLSTDSASRHWMAAAAANATGDFANALREADAALRLNPGLRYASLARDSAREALFLPGGAPEGAATFSAQGRRTAEAAVVRALARGDAAWDGVHLARGFAPAFVLLGRDAELLASYRSRFRDAGHYETAAPPLEQASVSLALALERAGQSAEAARMRQTAAEHLLRAEAGGTAKAQTALAWAALLAGRGERAEALAALDAGIGAQWWAVCRGPVWIGDLPALAPLRGEPGFQRIVKACADRINRERQLVGAPPLAG